MVPLALAASVRQLQQRAASAQVALRLGASVVALAQHLMLPPLQLVTTLVMLPRHNQRKMQATRPLQPATRLVVMLEDLVAALARPSTHPRLQPVTRVAAALVVALEKASAPRSAHPRLQKVATRVAAALGPRLMHPRLPAMRAELSLRLAALLQRPRLQPAASVLEASRLEASMGALVMALAPRSTPLRLQPAVRTVASLYLTAARLMGLQRRRRQWML